MLKARAALAALLSATALLAGGASAQEPVTLTFAAHYTDKQMEPLTACFREYERENPNIRIAYRQSPIADFLQTVLTGRAGGTSADILNVYSIWGARLVGSGVLAEPPAAITEMVETGYEPSTIESAKIDGKLWGVPAEVSLYLMVYNKALFEEAGIVDVPKTWDEVLQAAEKIAKRDELGKVTVAGYAFGPTVANATHSFRTLLFSKGVPLYGADGTAANLESPEAVAVLEGEAELFKRNLTSPAIQVRDFPSGSVGMMITANWFKQTLQEGLGDRFSETVGVAPIPAGPDWKTYQYSFYHAVDAQSPNGEEAWKLVRWLNAPRAEGRRSCTGDMLIALGGLSASKADLAASAAELGDAFTKPYVEALQSGRAMTDPNIVPHAEADKELRTAIEEAWLGQKSAADALAGADGRIEALLAEPQ